MADPFQGAIGAGLQEIAAGGDADDVVGAAVKEGVLNLLPLYALGQVVVALVDVVGKWTGKTEKLPILGFLIDPAAKTPAGGKAAFQLARKAATQYAMGLAQFQGIAPTILWGPPQELKWADDWLVDCYDRLANAWNRGGADEVLQELKTSAITRQATDAARALFQWAKSTIDTPDEWWWRMRGLFAAEKVLGTSGAGFPVTSPFFKWKNSMPKPVSKTFTYYAVKGYAMNERDVLNGAFGTNPVYFKGGERAPLKSKWWMFKSLGVPSYQEYADGIAAAAPPANVPGESEVFPGAGSMGFETGAAWQGEFEKKKAAQGLEGGVPDATQGQVSSLGPGVPKKNKAAQKREDRLVVGAAALGAGALLFALL